MRDASFLLMLPIVYSFLSLFEWYKEEFDS